ncbi:hypothetical protein FAI40_07165 [Acetobacteraceae bacterium]|nr:hypothetical protein FAI40_07165 [Acetobacteraceae bacterium]
MPQSGSHLLPPGISETVFRFSNEEIPLPPEFTTTIVCSLEFALNNQNPPTIKALRTLFQNNLQQLPVLTHFLKGESPHFQWESYLPQLDQLITEKTLSETTLENEIHFLLNQKLPFTTPWRVFLFKGYAENKFTIVFCVRHEVMDGGALITMIQTLFSFKSASSPVACDISGASQSISETAPELLKLPPEAKKNVNFWQETPSKTHIENKTLQFPASILPQIGKRFSVSGNDVYLYLMGKAIWQWRKTYQALPLPQDAGLSILVPINIRQAKDKNPGNRFYLKNLSVSEETSLTEISKSIDVFKQANIRKQLFERYAKNADSAFVQAPSPEYFFSSCSSLRLTSPIQWGKFPLLNLGLRFNSNLPIYTMLSTYAPKRKTEQEAISTLFLSFQKNIPNLNKVPLFYIEALETLAKKAGLTLAENEIRKTA